ncbi:RHS repeat domain-containing protein [Chitinophaga lutea]
MRILFIASLILAGAAQARAQYYYQDICNAAQTAQTMAAFKAGKVSFQHVRSLDANQETDNDFVCIRSMNPTYRQMRAVTQSRVSGRSALTSTFGATGKLLKTVDSTDNAISTVQYQYNAGGQLTEIQVQSKGREDKFRMNETRRYEYDTSGRLQRMVLKKGGPDSVIVLFKVDTAGRVTEEAYPGRQRIYYSYDAAGRLSDVLRYYPARKRMLPDYSFEYNADGKLAQMTVVNAVQGDYLIWRYGYDAKGLPLREDCYGKGNELLGRIAYRYEFFQ